MAVQNPVPPVATTPPAATDPPAVVHPPKVVDDGLAAIGRKLDEVLGFLKVKPPAAAPAVVPVPPKPPDPVPPAKKGRGFWDWLF